MSAGSPMPEVPLVVADPECAEAAEELGRRYGFPLAAANAANMESVGSYLEFVSAGLSLVSSVNQRERIRVDFIAGRSGYRLSTIAHTFQPVLRAIGCSRERSPRVLDATAGLGVDGMIMALAGCETVLLERSPVMAALLEDGLRRGRLEAEDEVLRECVERRVRLIHMESLEYFAGIGEDEFDVIYLDPMFPERKKSSKVKKEMQLTRNIVDWEDNAGIMLEAALQTTVRRIVLKRPLKAPLVRKGFSQQIKGKSIRFDVFLR